MFRESKYRIIGVLVAMDKELELFNSSFKTEEVTICQQTFYVTELENNKRVILCKSGIGKVNAAIATTLLITQFDVDIVLTTGVCGSLAPVYVNQGDIHITWRVKYHDVWCGEPNKPGQIQDMPEEYTLVTSADRIFIDILQTKFTNDNRTVRLGDTCSGDWFVDTREKALSIQSSNYSSTSVDMETGAIAQTAFRFGKRAVSVRIISDAILNKDCAKYDEFWSTAGNTLNELLVTMLNYIDKLF